MKTTFNKTGFAAWLSIPLLIVTLLSWSACTNNKLPIFGSDGTEEHGNNKGHVISPFHLLNEDSVRISSERYQGKIWICDFFFTRCTTVCPRMSSNMSLVQEAFKGDTSLAIFSFTVDPGNDNPSRLKIYANALGANPQQWHFFTGSKQDIYRIVSNDFLLTAAKADGDQFLHSNSFVLVDPQHRIRGFYQGTSDAEVKQLIKDIRTLKKEK